MKLDIGARAHSDLAAIARQGSRQFGALASKKYAAGIARALKAILTVPELAHVQAGISVPVRIYPVGSHMILYLVGKDTIRFLRVLHGHQDWQEYL